MKRKLFVISDTHFGHDNFLKFVDDQGDLIRPFNSQKELDEIMIDNWNSVVSPQDHVYHLGDVYYKDGWKCIQKLNGKKRLIIGNHDNPKSPYLLNNFQKIMLERLLLPDIVSVPVLLTHRPCFIDGREKFEINIHGHIHQNPSPTNKHINVSVERINYTPIDLEELCYEYRKSNATT